jgi:hypothetical protein
MRDGARAFRALAILTGLTLALGLHVALPAFSREFVAPPGRLVARAAPALGPCDTLVAVGPVRPSLVFYGRRPVTFLRTRDHERLAALSRGPARVVVLVPRTALPELPPEVAAWPPFGVESGYVLLGGPERTQPCLAPRP